jgi:hypothetical protein
MVIVGDKLPYLTKPLSDTIWTLRDNRNLIGRMGLMFVAWPTELGKSDIKNESAQIRKQVQSVTLRVFVVILTEKGQSP